MKSLFCVLLLIGSALVSGCDSESVLSKVLGANAAVIEASEIGEPLFVELERISGWDGIEPDRQSRIVHAANTIKAGGMSAKEIASTVGKILPITKPVTNTIETIGYLVALAGAGFSAFMSKRKTKKVVSEKKALELGTIAVMQTVDHVKDIGKAIEASTILAGPESFSAIKSLHQSNVAK